MPPSDSPAATRHGTTTPTLATHEGDPVENFLNTPVEANTSIFITEDENKGTLHLTGSQPTQYGYAATVAYQVEMALNEDFTTPAVDAEGVPASVMIGTFYDMSDIAPTLRSVAEGICKMLDIKESAAIPTDYMPVYMRLRANVVNENNQAIEGTAITSNTICYKSVAVGYLAVVIPDLPTGIYIRGALNEWLNGPLNEGVNTEILPQYEFMTTTEANTYELAYVEIPTNSEFKFADKNWGAPNISTGGPITQMNSWIDCQWNIQTNCTVSTPFKGAIQLQGADQKWKVMLIPAEPDTPDQPSGIFVTGDFAGWGFGDAQYQFYTTDVKNTWQTKVLTIPAGTFKVADSSWSNPNLGSNGEAIVPGVKYQAIFGANDNIPLAEEFTGTITLLKKSGNGISPLIPHPNINAPLGGSQEMLSRFSREHAREILNYNSQKDQ